ASSSLARPPTRGLQEDAMGFCFFECQFYLAAAEPTSPACERATAGVEGWGLGAILLALVRRILAGLGRCCSA
ncbi:MAG TPA: hypothetical protein VHM25_21740, partial [Polyangiaceae bacterium]|nr:hypothetical protein [Polyangiaceae bacterium]